MIRRTPLALFVCCFASWFIPNLAAAQQRPNIIYILADDLGMGDVRSYTPNSPVDTTHLNQLAQEGISFTNAHAPAAICTPTRYGILTGRYSWRTRKKQGVLTAYERPLIDQERITIADMLRDQGYDTALLGKWHLGIDWPTTDGEGAKRNGSNVDFTQPFVGGPVDHGFDSYFGDDIINYAPYTYIRDNQTIGEIDISNGRSARATDYQEVDVMPRITAEAVEYIGSHAGEDKPFFLFFAMTAPHGPIVPPDFISEDVGTKYDRFIATVDWSVGQIVEAIAANQIADNTLIIFTSDNGVAIKHCSSPEISPGIINGILLRGKKGDVWEGGHRVPYIMRWPGQIEAAASSDEYLELNDFYATMADLLDVELSAGMAEDSCSMLPAILGTEYSEPLRVAGVNHSSRGSFAIRQTDAQGTEWKLIFSGGSGGWSKPNGPRFNPLDPITDYSVLQLYNMTEDLGEQNNLLEGDGSAEYQSKVDAMQALLQQYINEGRSAPPR